MTGAAVYTIVYNWNHQETDFNSCIKFIRDSLVNKTHLLSCILNDCLRLVSIHCATTEMTSLHACVFFYSPNYRGSKTTSITNLVVVYTIRRVLNCFINEVQSSSFLSFTPYFTSDHCHFPVLVLRQFIMNMLSSLVTIDCYHRLLYS